MKYGTSLSVLWLRLHLPMRGLQIQTLVRELRSTGLLTKKNQNIKQKQCCNKFNKDFENGPHTKVKVKVAQAYPTLCNPTDYPVHGILQARILEWVVIPFHRGSSQPRDQT